jgi:hypothetical protein
MVKTPKVESKKFSVNIIELPEWSTYDFKGLFDEAFSMDPVFNRKFYRAIPKPHPDLITESTSLLISYRNLGGHLSRQGF